MYFFIISYSLQRIKAVLKCISINFETRTEKMCNEKIKSVIVRYLCITAAVASVLIGNRTAVLK